MKEKIEQTLNLYDFKWESDYYNKMKLEDQERKKRKAREEEIQENTDDDRRRASQN
jgi:hypothetical protein